MAESFRTFDQDREENKGVVKSYTLFVFFSEDVDKDRLKLLELGKEDTELMNEFAKALSNLTKCKLINKIEMGPFSTGNDDVVTSLITNSK